MISELLEAQVRVARCNLENESEVIFVCCCIVVHLRKGILHRRNGEGEVSVRCAFIVIYFFILVDWVPVLTSFIFHLIYNMIFFNRVRYTLPIIIIFNHLHLYENFP